MTGSSAIATTPALPDEAAVPPARPAVCILLRGSAIRAEVIALVRAMLADGRFTPVVVTASPAQASTVQAATGDRTRVVHLDGEPYAHTPDVGEMRDDRARSQGNLRNRLKTFLLRIPPLRTPILWRGLRADLAAAARLIDRIRPAAVAAFSDRTIRPEMALLRAAQGAAIPTVLLPFAVSSQESDAFLRRGATNLRLDRGPLAPARRAFARRCPDHALDTAYGPMLFYNAWESLALAAHGLHTTSPWIIGGGEVDRVAVACEADRDTALARGLPAGRIRVTGQASLDSLHAAHAQRGDIARTLRAQYGLDADQPIAICAAPHSAEHGLRSWDEHRADTEALFRALGSSGAVVLLSLHPKSDAETYQDAADRFGLRIAAEPLREILPAADIFVAGFSSTVRWAALLGIPTVVADLPMIGYVMYDDMPSIPKLADADSLARELATLAGDAGRRTETGAQLQSEARRAGMIDGQACARIIDLIAEVSGTVRQPASRTASS